MDNIITIDDDVYERYVVFFSMEVNETIKATIWKKTTSESLDEQAKIQTYHI